MKILYEIYNKSERKTYVTKIVKRITDLNAISGYLKVTKTIAKVTKIYYLN